MLRLWDCHWRLRIPGERVRPRGLEEEEEEEEEQQQ